MGHAYITHATCVGNRPKGASDWLIRIVIRSGSRAGTLVVCLDFLESAVNVIRKQIGEVEAEELLSPMAWEASVVRGTKMRVRVQIGPVFVGSVEKVSGGMFAIGHVVEKEAVTVGQRSCCWCWSFVFIRAKEEVVSKSADAT